MTILTDGTHLVSDTSLQELHTFAMEKLHFHMEWFQDKPGRPHYDLTTYMALGRAMHNGAKLVTPRELLQALLGAPYNAQYAAKRKRHSK